MIGHSVWISTGLLYIPLSHIRDNGATMESLKEGTAMDGHTTPSSLGEVIRHARECAGLSLRNVEAITGISRPTLNRLELNQIDNPSPAILHQLADTLELNSDDLFAFVGYRPSASLPSLAPYLRAKYQLPPNAVAEANEAIRGILERYDRTHAPKPSGGLNSSSGSSAPKNEEE